MSSANTVILATGDTRILKRHPTVPTTVRIRVEPVSLAAVVGARGLAAIVFAMSQVVVQEAPAWALSMVVHMVTLVTMAWVTTAPAVAFKAQHLVVTPPEEDQLEQFSDSAGGLPAASDDKHPDEVAMDVGGAGGGAGGSQGGAGGDGGFGGDGDGLDAVDAAPLSVLDTSDFAGDLVPPGDMMTSIVGGLADDASWAAGGGGSMGERRRLTNPTGPNEASERAVETALKWLANHQMPDGGWSFNHAMSPACRGRCRDTGKLSTARNAATGLALLPFLGNKQTHKESKRYKSTIENGLVFLVNHMRVGPQGGALNEPGGNMYSHGIAAIAICEAYAMTGDKRLQMPAAAALNFICYAQDPSGGGWRYMPHDKGDTSVLGWQLMALKSGYMAGLPVPPKTIRKASQFLDGVQGEGGALYGYLDANKGTDATVAIGLLSRMYLGWKKDNPVLQTGVKWLGRRGPSSNNMYYNYYATQVMHHWGGEEWKRWNEQMRDYLVRTQAREDHEQGSWFFKGGDLGSAAGGRVYCTAMAAMILEVYHKYMPIYGTRSVEDDFPN